MRNFWPRIKFNIKEARLILHVLVLIVWVYFLCRILFKYKMINVVNEPFEYKEELFKHIAENNFKVKYIRVRDEDGDGMLAILITPKDAVIWKLKYGIDHENDFY
jgi:hypothetical protein